jgi:hypothetical protein
MRRKMAETSGVEEALEDDPKFIEHSMMVKLDIFAQFMMVFFSSDIQKSWKKHKEVFAHGTGRTLCKQAGAFCAHYQCNDRNMCGIFLPLDASPKEIAHESFHAVISLMDYICADQSTAEGELGAHCLGYLVGKISEFKESGFAKELR